ncbi:BTAD domain-containing putative transcriptional regulator [Streptomyces capparidis]
MLIHLLGPVELHGHGRRFPLRSNKERLVLAALALDVGRPVARDTLVDRLWDDRAPAGARANVHSYISRIRGVLRLAAPGEGSWSLTHQSHTYRLTADPDSIDLHRFQRLTAQAGALADSGDDVRAAALLTEAEELWQGEALAGLPGRWAESTRESLDEKRIAATSARVAARLRLGHFAELTGELSALVDLRPEDETLVGHLMVAYHGCGRHAEALRLYQRTRRLLREEFGSYPDEELAALHRRILAREPALTLLGGAAAGTAPDTAPPPRNLPRYTPLVGRETELRNLRAAVETAAGHGSVVTLEAISGMAGVGKTAVAVSAADRFGEHFPDGQFYLDLRGAALNQEPLSPSAALGILLRDLGVPANTVPSTVEERAALWRTMLARRRAVVVLDDAADPEQVRPLLPGPSPSLTIITSRRRLTGLPGVRSVALDVLPPADAMALFRGLTSPERTRDTDELARVVRLCGYLPLAVEMAAARFDAHPSWDLATLRERLERSPGRLGEIRDGNREIARVFEVSYQALTRDQRTAFRRLGLHFGAEFGPYAATALLGIPLERTERLLEELHHRHLIQEPTAHRFKFHDLLGEFARSLALSEDDEEERALALRRLIDFYVCAADQADRALFPRRLRLEVHHAVPAPPLPLWRNADEARGWFAMERSTLLAVESHARTHGAPERAAVLSHLLMGFLEAECHWSDAERLSRHAVDHWTGSDDRTALCLALLDLSNSHTSTSRYAEATDAGFRALELARGDGNTAAEAEALRGLGVLHYHLGQHQTALAFHRAGLRLQEEAGEPLGVASCHNNIAISLLHLGDYENALAYFNRALAEFQQTGHQLGVGRTLNNLGDLYLRTGELASARRTFEDSLSLTKKSGNVSDQAITQLNLVDILSACGETTSALDIAREALFILRRLGDRKQQANALNRIGVAYQGAGCAEEALAHHQSALELSRAIGAAHEEAQSLRHLGEAEASLGRLYIATEHLEGAVTLADRIQAMDEGGRARDALAGIQLQSGQSEKAYELWQQAFDMLRGLDGTTASKIHQKLISFDHIKGESQT